MNKSVNNLPVNPSSGGGSRGGWVDKLFGMFRARSMEQLNKDRFAWQQTFLTEQMNQRAMNAAAAQAAGKVVGTDMMQKNNAKNAFAFEKKRTSKNKKTGEFNYPELQEYGPAEDPLNARWSPRSGVAYQAAMGQRQAEARDTKFTPAGNPPNDGGNSGGGGGGRKKRPYVTKKEVSDAVSSGNIQEAEGLGLNKAYDSMVAKREDNAGKIDTTPSVGPKKVRKPRAPKAGA